MTGWTGHDVLHRHVWLWFLANHPRLSSVARGVLQGQEDRLILPATAHAEACWIVEHGRLPALTVADLQAALSADVCFAVYPLDQAIIDRSQGLTVIHEMHDRQIAATALALADAGEMVALVTHEADLTASGRVPMVW